MDAPTVPRVCHRRGRVQVRHSRSRQHLLRRSGFLTPGPWSDDIENTLSITPSEGLCFILHLISCNRGELFFLQVTSFASVLLRQIVARHFEEIIPFIVVSMSA